MWRSAVLATLLGACGASLADDPSQHSAVDAPQTSTGDSTTIGIPDAATVSMPDAPAAPARVVYLNFDGVTLTKANASDATNNKAAWMTSSPGTAPPYNNTTGKTTIVDGVTARLTGIATVVTTRPASGEYVMVVYGGTAQQVHSFYGQAVAQLDCNDTVKNDVAWISSNVNPTDAIDTTMGAIGFGLGLSSVNKGDDCMCSWADNCTPNNNPCVLRDNQTRDTNVGNDPNLGTPQICPGATQNELTTFKTAFATP